MLFAATTAEAQWLNYPTAGIPRRSDGKPDTNAPTPRTADGKPDLSGIWRTPTQKYLENLAADGVEVLMHPWAEQLYKQRLANEGRDRPSAACLPHSVTDFDAHFTPKKVLQLPGLVVMLFESYRSYRQIHTDGRPLPVDPQPAWLGYSVGRWEGDTFVVESNGLSAVTWLDDGGHPHGDGLLVTERYRRVDFGHLETAMTIDDPEYYTRPWTVTVRKQLLPDGELIEWMCENEKDLTHMVGK